MLTARPHRDRHRADRGGLSGDDRARLCRHHEGHVHYQTGRGPRCLAVTYTVAGDHVLLRFPEYNELGRYASGRPVVLEVPDADHPVQVMGVARVVGPALDPLVQQARFPEPAPDGVASRVISLPIDGLVPVRSTQPERLEQDGGMSADAVPWFPLHRGGRVEILDVLEGQRPLASAPVGRLGYTTDSGSRIVPMNFSLVHDALFLRTAPDGEVGRWGIGRQVCFEVDHIHDFLQAGWSVLVIGRLEEPSPART